MGVKVTSDGGAFALALGEYLLDFSMVEGSLALLFSILRSEDENKPGTWDPHKRQEALQEIDRKNLSVGALAKETDKLLDALVPRPSRAIKESQRLREIGEPLVKYRNDLVHKHLVTMEDVLDEPLTGIILSTDECGQPEEVLTAQDLRSQATKLHKLDSDLRILVTQLLTERLASTNAG